MLSKSGLNNPNYKHGLSKTRLYRIWANMKSRCTNPNVPAFNDYGGRGINVCVDWMNNFESFHNWALKHGYEEHLTIDRIDNDKGYSPDNCRWMTRKKQTLNTRNNHLITIGTEIKTIDEWCAEYQINRHTVHDRLKRGWNEEDAITKSIQKKFGRRCHDAVL